MPEAAHFEPGTLQSFLLGQLAADQTREVVKHLLSGCEHCQTVAEGLWLPGRLKGTTQQRPEFRAPSLEGVLERVRRRESNLANERMEAPSLYEELAPHPIARQLMLVRNSPRLQTWGLCEHLLECSWEARFDDPVTTVELAEAAVAVAEQLPPQKYGAALTHDLKARTWGYLANAQRIRGDYRAAEENLRIAESMIQEGTEDPLERARLVRFKAALRHNQGRYQEALRLHDRVISIYGRLQDHECLGQAYQDKAGALQAIDETDQAIGLMKKAIGLMEASGDPRLRVVANHNLVYLLMDSGDLEGALVLLRETRPLYLEIGDRLNLLRLRRLEGQIALKLGHTALAEAALLEARNGFISQGIGLEAAEISLELTGVYLEQGRNHETRQLAVQMMPIFQSQDMHEEALSALILFQSAAQADTVTLELVRDILAYLERAKDEPALKFRRGFRREEPC